jgi:hypothetical protein
MSSQPDPKTLPAHKKSALADKVAEGIHKEFKRHVDDLKSHEVSKEDSNEILNAGLRRGVERVNKDLEQ